MQHHVRESSEAATTGRGEKGATARRIMDGQGCTWSVRERVGDAWHHAGRSSLTFECARAIRRVWTYPPSWRGLSDEELIALSWKS